MWFWKLHSAEAQYSREAVIDIGSDTITSLVFARGEPRGEQTAPPRILKKMKIGLASGSDRPRTAEKFHELMGSFVKESGAAPQKVTVNIGSYLADYTMASWEAPLPGKEAEINGHDLTRIYHDLIRAHMAPERTLSAYPVGMSVNGYPVNMDMQAGGLTAIRFLSSPKNKKGTDAMLAVRSLLVSVPKPVADTIEKTRVSWGGIPMEFTALPIAYQVALPKNPDFPDPLIIDISGYGTMIVRMKDARVEAVGLFSSGTHAIISALAADMNIPFREAQDLLATHAQGTGRDADHGPMQERVSRASDAWRTLLITALNEHYRLGPISGNVLVTGAGANIGEIVSAIRRDDWMKNFSPVPTPSVRILRAESLFEGNSLGGFLGGPEDADLAALLRYALRHNHPMA